MQSHGHGSPTLDPIETLPLKINPSEKLQSAHTQTAAFACAQASSLGAHTCENLPVSCYAKHAKYFLFIPPQAEESECVSLCI